MNTALIVAAGSGTRFSTDQPKQFISLLGRPIIEHTLRVFDNCDAIDEIVLVLSDEGQRQFELLLVDNIFAKLRSIVVGGPTRARSVSNGLAVIEARRDAIVAVHDGARPLVSAEDIEQVIAKASETGAACLVSEITDTVKHVADGRIVGTADRRLLRRALTPQAFKYDILKRAFDTLSLDESVTDECYLVEQLGFSIEAVESSSRNIKITRPDDLRLAEFYLSS